MIGQIRGTLIARQAPEILVDVGGIGYEIQVPMTTLYQLPELGQPVTLLTHFVVREDAQLLYGFADHAERKLFCALIKVNGVGPKLALAILSGMDVRGFARCILANDLKSLTCLPGVGKKTAERLVIEMKDRMHDWQAGDVSDQELDTADDNRSGGGHNILVAEAETALIALGYKPVEASKAIAKLDFDQINTAEDAIRAALQSTLRR